MQPSIRHLRMFQALARTHSVTRTAEVCHVSQPAVTQALRKLELDAGVGLLNRTSGGIFLTEAGQIFSRRVDRALGFLDHAMSDMKAAIRYQATRPQLTALIAVTELENLTLAARKLGLAQPTVHRSTSQLEHSAGVQFFERTANGLIATRAAQALAQAARLAFSELEQAQSELANLSGRDSGRIVIGALPLSRSGFLPEALIKFRKTHPTLDLEVIDGRYHELLLGLRRGEIDMVIGALRLPAPVEDIVQERLFDDSVVIVARRDHPLASHPAPTPADLARFPWVMARKSTPIRAALDALMAPDGPASVIETSSVIMLREILRDSDHIGGLSRMQASAPSEAQTLTILPVELPQPHRPIGITTREGWVPTRAQDLLLTILRRSAAELS